jgi:hypothetical protein
VFERGAAHAYAKSVASLGSNFPVPLGIFMNMADIPPRFYQQQKVQNDDSRKEGSHFASTHARKN